MQMQMQNKQYKDTNIKDNNKKNQEENIKINQLVVYERKTVQINPLPPLTKNKIKVGTKQKKRE